MYGELDESKFALDYNEEMTPLQNSQDEVWYTNKSSICSMDLLVLDEERCSSDEVEVPTSAANQSLDTRMEQPVTSKLQPAFPKFAPYHCPLCGISLSGHVKRMFNGFTFHHLGVATVLPKTHHWHPPRVLVFQTCSIS